MKKIIITLLLIIPVLISGCSAVGQKEEKKKEEVAPDSKKIYLNATYGFMIEHPVDWQFEDSVENSSGYESKCITAEKITEDQEKIEKYSENILARLKICGTQEKNLFKYLENIGYHFLYGYYGGEVVRKIDGIFERYVAHEVRVDGYPIISFSLPSGDKHYVYFTRGDRAYSIEAVWKAEEFSIFDAIEMAKDFKIIPVLK